MTGGGFTGTGRPATLPSGPGAGLSGAGLAGGAAAEFLSNLPAPLPGGSARPGVGDIASSLPARPGGGRPDVGRPGQPGERPGDIGRPGRPDAGQPGRPGRPDVGEPGRPDIGEPGRPDIGRPGRPDVGQPGRPDIGRPGQPGRELVQNLPSRIEDRGKWQDWRQENRGAIAAWWRNHAGDSDDWFGDDWWLANHLRDLYDDDFNFWAWAAWPGVVGWVNYGWSEPVYYNYGSNVYYDGGYVYYGEQAICTEAEYADQAEAIATNVPETKPAEDDWMPLGVYAVTSDGQPTGVEPTMFLQLAVSKQGIISGTFQTATTKDVQQIEGMVDKQTQRAAWTAVGKTRPLMETGIVNLTEDTTPVLVHFPDEVTQQWLLVRMKQPDEQSKSSAN